jgi:hypothetical protein
MLRLKKSVGLVQRGCRIGSYGLSASTGKDFDVLWTVTFLFLFYQRQLYWRWCVVTVKVCILDKASIRATRRKPPWPVAIPLFKMSTHHQSASFTLSRTHFSVNLSSIAYAYGHGHEHGHGHGWTFTALSTVHNLNSSFSLNKKCLTMHSEGGKNGVCIRFALSHGLRGMHG